MWLRKAWKMLNRGQRGLQLALLLMHFGFVLSGAMGAFARASLNV